MWPLATLLLGLAVASIASLLGRLLAAVLLKAPVEEVDLFFGPALFRFTAWGVAVRVALLPIGNSVKFTGDIEKPDEADDAVESVDPPRKTFSALPLASRLAIFIASDLALLGLACLCLGPVGGLRSTWRGFNQFLAGGLRPLTVGTDLIHRLFTVFERSPTRVSFGIIAAKMVAANLMPWPPNDGGRILGLLAGGLTERRSAWMLRAALVGFFLTLGLLASWLIAIARVQLEHR